jgi:hypothetical protein
MGKIGGKMCCLKGSTNKYHFIYTFEAPRLEGSDPSILNKWVVATDPGVRAFQTWSSPTTGQHGELLI